MKDVYEKLGFIVGVSGIAYSTVVYFKLKKIAAIVDMSVEELSKKTNIEIEKSMIEKAVQRSVEREVNDAISYASRTAVMKISEDISTQVKKAVDLSYFDIKRAVSDEIAKQASNVDINKIKEEAISKAKEAALEKFNGNLDDILGEFNHNLKYVSKVYESMTNSAVKKQEKEIVLRII